MVYTHPVTGTYTHLGRTAMTQEPVVASFCQCTGGSRLVPEAPALGESREMRSALYLSSGGTEAVPE